MLTRLTPELCEAVILQLPPRHVYKLMQTNKQFLAYCKSESYWARVAMPMVWCWVWPGDLPILSDMVLLHQSYKNTLDYFIQRVREELRTFSDGCEREADSPVSKLVVFGQQIGENYRCADQIKTGETAIQLVKRKVEDTDSLLLNIESATQGMDVPRQPGFITSSRRATRARSTFLRSLEDDEGMDLQTKLRVRGYVTKLLRDFTERRGSTKSFPRFELHEADLDTSNIHL
jgi:hypothetical protein